ncbi:hypothetical protein [Streptomyces luteireticuli]
MSEDDRMDGLLERALLKPDPAPPLPEPACDQGVQEGMWGKIDRPN